MRHFAQLTLQGNNGQPIESLAYEVTEEQVEVLESLVSRLSKVFDIALLVQTSKDDSIFTPRSDVPVEAAAPVAPEAPEASVITPAPEEAPQAIEAPAFEEVTEEPKSTAKKKK